MPMKGFKCFAVMGVQVLRVNTVKHLNKTRTLFTKKNLCVGRSLLLPHATNDVITVHVISLAVLNNRARAQQSPTYLARAMADLVDSFCFTDAKNSTETTFAWTIKNYDASSCENLESPTFESITHDGRKLQWQLSLHSAAGFESRSINPRLKLKSVIEGSVTVVFTFYLINNKKEKVHVN